MSIRSGAARKAAVKRAATSFSLAAVTRSEDSIHESVAKALDVLLLPPAEWTCFPAGNVRIDPVAGAKLTRFGLKRGWPDILILHDGRIYGIELKRSDGSLSKTRIVRTRRGKLRTLVGQAEMFPRLRAAGMTIAVCRSVDDVLRCLALWSIPTREAARPHAASKGTNSRFEKSPLVGAMG